MSILSVVVPHLFSRKLKAKDRLVNKEKVQRPKCSFEELK